MDIVLAIILIILGVILGALLGAFISYRLFQKEMKKLELQQRQMLKK
jgi:uncharacterized protein YneF (UPF0154 family)